VLLTAVAVMAVAGFAMLAITKKEESPIGF